MFGAPVGDTPGEYLPLLVLRGGNIAVGRPIQNNLKFLPRDFALFPGAAIEAAKIVTASVTGAAD